MYCEEPPTATPTISADAISLRSGTQYEGPQMPVDEEKKNTEAPATQEKDPAEPSDKGKEAEDKVKEKQPEIIVPPVQLPFPNRVGKSKLDVQFEKFLKIVKDLQVTIPFTDLITQIPAYTRYLKDILSRKGELKTVETIAFTEGCSAILQNKSPPKLKDPGSFSIPCNIGQLFIENALCDLGASVSIMPWSVCKKLDIGPIQCTNMVLQMADRSLKHPMGIMRDVPVRVGKFFIPVDFIVVDMAEDMHIPIILGRPFLNTAGAVIDVKKGVLLFKIGDDEITFNINNKHLDSRDECYEIDVINSSSCHNPSDPVFDDFSESILCMELSAGEQGKEVAAAGAQGRPPDTSWKETPQQKGTKPSAGKKGRAVKKKDIEDPSFSSNRVVKGQMAKAWVAVEPTLSNNEVVRGKVEVMRLQPPPVS